MATLQRCKLLLLISLSIFISSCASVGIKESSIKEMNITANVDDSDIFEEKKYTVFNDIGDHFEALVKTGYFRKAARLYDKYHESYFMKMEPFSKKTRKEKYAVYFDMIANHLDCYFRKNINDSSSRIESHTIWPLPSKEWSFISADINNAQKIIDEYNTFYLLNEDRYRISGIESLKRLTKVVNGKLEFHSSISFNSYDLFNEKDFFEQYPYDISDKNKFISINFSSILNRLRDASCDDLEKFNSIYKKYINLDTGNLIGNLYVENFINKQKGNSEKVRLSLLIDAIKAANGKGFRIQNIEGQKISFVESTSKSLLDLGYIEFPAKVDVDLPFAHKTCDIENAFSEAAESNFVIVFDVAQANVKRRIKNREQVKSKYLDGYKDVQNPYYKQVVIALRDTERGLQSAQNSYCGGGGLAAALCEAAKTFSIISWRNRLNEVNQLYITTPEYIQEEVHKNYQFSVSNVEVTKSMTVNYYILDRVNKNYFKSTFDVSEEKTFKIAYSLKAEDTRLSSHISNYNKEKDIETFESSAVSVKLSSLIQDYLTNIDKTKSLLSETSLRTEMLQDKNIALASYKKNKYETKSLNDPRFNNVVVIFNPKGAIGSGFFVGPNLVLTNYHVVEGSKFLEMKLYNGLETFGKTVKSDVKLDLALIKAEARGEVANFCDSKTIDLGVEVEAIGHPKGLEFSITRGIVSAIRKRKSVYDTGGKELLFIQTDAAINPGNSGGPLFLNDKVIGVINQKIVADAVEGLGFALHYSEVQKFLKEDF